VKILYFSKDYTPHDFRFLDGLSATDHEIYFLRLEAGPFTREVRPIPSGVTKVSWPAGGGRYRRWKSFTLGRVLKRLLYDLQPDIIHAGPIQECAFLVASTGYSPLVSMSWGSDLLLGAKGGWGNWTARYTLDRSTILLCDCEAVAERGRELGMPNERIVVFPWGIDLEHFSPGRDHGLREELGWEDAIILLSMRAWEPIYGVDLIVEAFLELAQMNPTVRLLLLGDGSLRSRIDRKIRHSDFEDRAHCAGHVDFDLLPQYFHAADLYLSASHVDGSSISLLEAMACGVPAVVSDIPGNKEWIVSGVNGWLFKDGSVQSLLETLEEAVRDVKNQHLFGMRSREVTRDRADWEFNFQILLDAYQLALALEREAV
jgi:glycosyltransferase involved in cell wall biosynthesis